jgi:hypothetical protein
MVRVKIVFRKPVFKRGKFQGRSPAKKKGSKVGKGMKINFGKKKRGGEPIEIRFAP